MQLRFILSRDVKRIYRAEERQELMRALQGKHIEASWHKKESPMHVRMGEDELRLSASEKYPGTVHVGLDRAQAIR